jgi:anthranilate synthase component 2
MALRILLADNYDSFTWNLQHYLVSDAVAPVVDVVRYDEAFPDVAAFHGVVISPGPGLPQDAGWMMELIAACVQNQTPLLGVCLGMQGIAQFFGSDLYRLQEIYHGRSSLCNVIHAADPLFAGIPESFQAGRYHSWAVCEPLPEVLIPTARTKSGVLMSFRHHQLPVSAVQFHPESILTPEGKQLMANWLSTIRP